MMCLYCIAEESDMNGDKLFIFICTCTNCKSMEVNNPDNL